MKSFRKFLLPLITLTLFSLSLFVINRELKHFHYHDIAHEIAELGSRGIALSFLLTAISYFILTGYDVLSFRYIKKSLSYPKIAFASFVGYTLSHNLGFSLLTGSAARFRVLSAWGLSGEEIAQIITFSGLTFWLGFFLLSGTTLCLHPVAIATFSPQLSQWLGVLFLIMTAAYLVLISVRKKPFALGGIQFQIPSLKLTAVAILLSCLDWTAAAAVFYTLLPTKTAGFLDVLGLFLLAQIIGVSSHVPGGLGVFESVVILTLQKIFPVPQLAGVLVAYRLIYYIIPLVFSLTMLLAHEVWLHHGKVARALAISKRQLSTLTPSVMVVFTFLCGVILLFSGATARYGAHSRWVQGIVPLPLLELSHFSASIVGTLLLLLSHGLKEKLRSAHQATVVLLAVGIVACLLKGMHLDEAAVLFVVLLLMIDARQFFYRKAALFSAEVPPTALILPALTVAITTWLFFFSHKHVAYAHELWWQFTFDGAAPRSLRATSAMACVFLIYAVRALLFPRTHPVKNLNKEINWDAVKEIVSNSSSTYANLAYLGDKYFLFDEARSAFVMYACEQSSWIALGDPVGTEEGIAELVWRFRELADVYAGESMFYEIRPDYLHLYIDAGYDVMKIGEEALISLREFTLEGQKHSSFRHSINKLEKTGYSFEIIPQAQTPMMLATLRTISDAWLAQKNAKEKGFSLGFFEERYLSHFPIAVVRRAESIIAFANIWETTGHQELSVDLMRYLPDAPGGTMDYLFLKMMLWGAKEGFERFNMGMAPLSGFQTHPLAPLWSKLGGIIYRHGEHFYNFQGIRQYKEKFHPQWESRYLAGPGGLKLLRIATNITALISGGLRGILRK